MGGIVVADHCEATIVALHDDDTATVKWDGYSQEKRVRVRSLKRLALAATDGADGMPHADDAAKYDDDGEAGNVPAMRELAAASGVANDLSRSPSRMRHGSAARSTVFKEQLGQLMGRASVYAVDDDDGGGADFGESDDGESDGGGAGSRRRRPASARGSGAGAAAGSVAAAAGGGCRRRRRGGGTDKPFDPAKSSRWRAAVLEQGVRVTHTMPPPTKVISVPVDSLRDIVDEKARVLVDPGKGVGVERIRRIVADEIAPCAAVGEGSVFIRAAKSRKGAGVAEKGMDVRWTWRCSYGGCKMRGFVGWNIECGNADSGTIASAGGGGAPSAGNASSVGGSTVSDVTIFFNQSEPPCHFEAQETHGVSQLRGDTRSEMVKKLTAALPTAQRRTPAGLYNSRLHSANPQQQPAPAPRGGGGIGPGAALPAVRVASVRVMANAMRESGEVAPDPDLWDSLNTLAAEMRVKGPGELYLQEYSQKANHIRASTYSRASIACYRESVGMEGCAFLDITGSVIAKLRHRADATDKPVYTLALSVPTPAGTLLDRSKPLRCLTSHGTGLLGAAEVKVVVEDFRGAECEHFGGNVHLPYMVRSCPPPHEKRERASSTTPHHTTPHHTTPHRTTPHRTAPHRTTPHHIAPHYITLHYTTLD